MNADPIESSPRPGRLHFHLSRHPGHISDLSPTPQHKRIPPRRLLWYAFPCHLPSQEKPQRIQILTTYFHLSKGTCLLSPTIKTTCHPTYYLAPTSLTNLFPPTSTNANTSIPLAKPALSPPATLSPLLQTAHALQTKIYPPLPAASLALFSLHLVTLLLRSWQSHRPAAQQLALTRSPRLGRAGAVFSHAALALATAAAVATSQVRRGLAWWADVSALDAGGTAEGGLAGAEGMGGQQAGGAGGGNEEAVLVRVNPRELILGTGVVLEVLQWLVVGLMLLFLLFFAGLMVEGWDTIKERGEKERTGVVEPERIYIQV